MTAGLADGDFLTEWVDASPFGTRFAPRTQGTSGGPLDGLGVEEAPQLEMVQIGPNLVPTVRFNRTLGANVLGSDRGDPNVPGSGSVDRLFQTNNLGAGDPLNIGNATGPGGTGEDLTVFLVYNADFTTTTGILPFQPLVAKRGTSTSVWEVGIVSQNGPGRDGRLHNVNYDATVIYASGSPISEGTWHVSVMTIAENGANDLVDFFDDDSEDPNGALASIGSVPAQIDNRNPSTPEPAAIGGHSQACCGEGETFSGNIAEIIIYAEQLSAEDFGAVDAYLHTKYFVPEPGTVSLLTLGLFGCGLVGRNRRR